MFKDKEMQETLDALLLQTSENSHDIKEALLRLNKVEKDISKLCEIFLKDGEAGKIYQMKNGLYTNKKRVVDDE
jgi:hypothetical protein